MRPPRPAWYPRLVRERRVELLKAGELARPSEEPPAREPEAAPEAPVDWQDAWNALLRDLSDEDAHQRFIRACLSAGKLPFALESYRRLQQLHPAEARLGSYVQQISKLLQFHALGSIHPHARNDRAPLRRPMQMMWTLIVAIAALLALYATVVVVRHGLDL